MIAYFLLIAFLQADAEFGASGAWLAPPPSPRSEWVELPSDSFFEVASSKHDAAMYRLLDPAIPLDGENSVAYFGNGKFECTESRKPYLVRAPYTNGATGGFKLFLWGKSLIVEHGSLGGGTELEHSALVVCLTEKPDEVYSSISSAL